MHDFQNRVDTWLTKYFGVESLFNKSTRNHRFFEEATELVQATGMTASEAHQLVDYVFSRPVGEPAQEVGGVMVTLAALCTANTIILYEAADKELKRAYEKMDLIREKSKLKPKIVPIENPKSVYELARRLV